MAATAQPLPKADVSLAELLVSLDECERAVTHAETSGRDLDKLAVIRTKLSKHSDASLSRPENRSGRPLQANSTTAARAPDGSPQRCLDAK
jgi:hypothetical protein